MKSLVNASGLMVLLLVSACGLPVNQLSEKERKIDMEWAFSVFHHNYAPAELKKTNYGVEISQVESDCVAMAQEEMDNQAFLALFQKCIHTFKDAHVGAQQMNNGLLPEYAQVAHLGFITMRTKTKVDGAPVNALKIIQQLKGSDNSGAPLVPNDLIIRIDGQPVKDYLMQEIVPYINVGQDETSLTQAAFRFGVRTSIDMALPEKDEIELVVARGSMVFTIVLPWIKQDMLAFQLKQNPPEAKPEVIPQGDTLASKSLPGKEFQSMDDVVADFETGVRPTSLMGLSQNSLAQAFLGYQDVKELINSFDTPLAFVGNRLKWIAMTGYQWAKFNPLMRLLFDGDLDKDRALSLALKNRVLPQSEQVTDLMTRPLFKAQMITTDEGGTYAYIQLKNFPSEDKILTEWYRAITAIEDKGIKSVIIDMIDNTGGSLIHGLRMVNMLRRKPIAYPSMQVRLNNNWINSFKSQAAFSESDYQKAISGKVAAQLVADLDAGKTLSSPFSVTVMDPFFLQNPGFGVADDVKVALLVNEMCVSMCDIFASIFQENEMGQIIGQRTMGGGGNVVQHGLSPISKMGMALTESLMISSSGEYLEDSGVEPDIYVDMVADRESGFSSAFKKAYQYITSQKQ